MKWPLVWRATAEALRCQVALLEHRLNAAIQPVEDVKKLKRDCEMYRVLSQNDQAKLLAFDKRYREALADQALRLLDETKLNKTLRAQMREMSKKMRCSPKKGSPV